VTVEVYIYGAGGFGSEMYWLLEEEGISVVGFFDDDQDKAMRYYMRVACLSGKNIPIGESLFIAVGDSKARHALVKKLEPKKVKYMNLIEETARMPYFLDNDPVGLYVGPNTTITNNVHFGEHIHIHYNCSVGHDVDLGDFVSIYPSACVSGDVTIGDRTMIGANATILPGITIGDDCMIGAGAIITKDIPNEHKAYWNVVEPII